MVFLRSRNNLFVVTNFRFIVFCSVAFFIFVYYNNAIKQNTTKQKGPEL